VWYHETDVNLFIYSIFLGFKRRHLEHINGEIVKTHLFHIILARSYRIHPASCLMDTMGCYAGCEAARD
jgi:hypothetical protein